jgi:probable F420-dependent oxidoreductase
MGELRLGLGTPVLTMLPGAHARWEERAGIEEVARVAEAADRLGYDHLTCSEHVALPEKDAAVRGGRYWDPLATFGYLSARTQRIKLATFVLVLGYHHPLAIAKRYGTLDAVSGGRLILGVGVGSLQAEFDLLGAPYDDRGRRADDAMRALRASLSQHKPSYEGEYFSFSGLIVDPCSVQEKVPLWVGGRTPRSLRRAVELADGWCPFAVSVAQASEWVKKAGCPKGFDIVLAADAPLDPIGDVAGTEQALLSLSEAGATVVASRFIHHSLEHFIEQMEALVSCRTRAGLAPDGS